MWTCNAWAKVKSEGRNRQGSFGSYAGVLRGICEESVDPHSCQAAFIVEPIHGIGQDCVTLVMQALDQLRGDDSGRGMDRYRVESHRTGQRGVDRPGMDQNTDRNRGIESAEPRQVPEVKRRDDHVLTPPQATDQREHAGFEARVQASHAGFEFDVKDGATFECAEDLFEGRNPRPPVCVPEPRARVQRSHRTRRHVFNRPAHAGRAQKRRVVHDHDTTVACLVDVEFDRPRSALKRQPKRLHGILRSNG